MTKPRDLLVVSLCAAWCGACNEFRATFDRLAAADPGSRYLWLDVEDDSALVGDLEIENFPTLAVFRDRRPVFYGVTLPNEGVIARTLASLRRDTGARLSRSELDRAALDHLLGAIVQRLEIECRGRGSGAN